MILPINNHHFPIQRYVIGFRNGITRCSLWGANGIFNVQESQAKSGQAMGHVVTLRSHTRESQVRFLFGSYKILVKTCHWDRFFSECFGFSLSVSFLQSSTLIFVCILPLSEGQTGEAWKPSTQQRSFRNRRGMDRNEVLYFLLNRRHSSVEAQVQFWASL